MLVFNPPKIEDKIWVDPIVKSGKNLAYIFSFGTLFIWRVRYNIQICNYNNMLLISYGKGNKRSFSFPVYGEGTSESDIKDAVNAVIEYARENGLKPRFLGLTQDKVDLLQACTDNAFECEEDRDNWEYIYNAEDLAYLKGGKYHSKRNHIARFGKTYNWTYESLNNDNILQAKEVAKKWCHEKGCGLIDDLHSEYCSIKESVNHFDELGFFGGLIKVDGEPVAMSIGEEVFEDMVVVHYEKAVESYQGAYTVVNNSFSKDLLERGYKYINREEDLGIEGLRKAKLSYKPEILLEIYACTLKE